MSTQRVMYFASSFDEEHQLVAAQTEGIDILKSVNSIPEWKCIPSFRIRDDIVLKDFTKRDFSYQVFHFAGHAVDKKLQFNGQVTDMEKVKYDSMFMVGVGALAKIIRALHPIQLVFLNGCATHTQVDLFRKEGIPAVIYTTRALSDAVGKAFAVAFYHAFLVEKNTLIESFNLATDSVELSYPNFQTEYDNETEAMFKRGVADLDALPPMALYDLVADDAFKQLAWEQWPMNLANEPVLPLPSVTLPQDPRDKQKKGIPLEAVHLCDRNAETDKFRAVLRQLATSQTSGPVFVFVHDQSEACPESLVKRFELFGVNELCSTDRGIDPAGFVWKDVKLRYEQNILKHPDWCKSRLFEIYNDELFPCDHDAAMQNFVFRPSQYGNKVFVVHHDLTELEPENAASVRPLLEFYLHEFSGKLVAELQARLVVVISYQYFMEEKDMETLFSELTADPRFLGRVLNLTGMEAVTPKHVGVWRNKVFEDRNFPLPPDVKEFFPNDQGGTWSMNVVRKKLADTLEQYNHKIETSHGRP